MNAINDAGMPVIISTAAPRIAPFGHGTSREESWANLTKFQRVPIWHGGIKLFNFNTLMTPIELRAATG